MKKVRCAVIGAGWWGTTAHIPALKSMESAELVAVQNQDKARAQKIAADFGIPLGTSSVEEVLALEGLDAVVISSTPNVHHEHAKAALEKGLHILVEKPLTLTAQQADDLVEIARRKERHFLVSSPWHYTPHGIEARRLVQSGALGQLKMISVLMTNFTIGFYEGRPWEELFGAASEGQDIARPYLEPGRRSYNDPAVAGGGQIYCQVSHVAAYLGFLTDRQPTEVFARLDNAGTPVDVYNSLNIKLADGTLVSMASHGLPMPSERQHEVRVYGTEGALLLELWKGTMEFQDREGNIRRYPDVPEADIYPMFAPARNLVEVVAGTAPNGSPGSLGAYAIRIIEAACSSARTNSNVILRG
jgi:predicted dehydrogenase